MVPKSNGKKVEPVDPYRVYTGKLTHPQRLAFENPLASVDEWASRPRFRYRAGQYSVTLVVVMPEGTQSRPHWVCVAAYSKPRSQMSRYDPLVRKIEDKLERRVTKALAGVGTVTKNMRNFDHLMLRLRVTRPFTEEEAALYLAKAVPA